MPGFPAKSANRKKTLGPLPDLGEELSLRFLAGLCEEIREFHAAGARITICSDGRVFNDLVGVADEDVTGYRQAIARLIEQFDSECIDTFDLDDVFQKAGHDAAREQLTEQYAEPLETVVERAKQFFTPPAPLAAKQPFSR